MPRAGEDFRPVTKALNVFFVLDTSGSMEGSRIGQLNQAMTDTVAALKKAADEHDSAELRLAILSFASEAKWLTEQGPVYCEDYYYEPLEAGGMTEVGQALNELNAKLSRSQFLNSIAGNYMPVIIFMTDGQATDDYERALQKIHNNKWFNRSVKIGFAIGDDPDLQMITDIVGNKECVIRLTDGQMHLLGKLVRFTTVSASMLSGSSQVNGANSANDIASQVIDMAVQQGELDKSQTLADRNDIKSPPPPPEANEPFDKDSCQDAPSASEGWDEFYS